MKERDEVFYRLAQKEGILNQLKKKYNKNGKSTLLNENSLIEDE